MNFGLIYYLQENSVVLGFKMEASPQSTQTSCHFKSHFVSSYVSVWNL